MVKPPAGHPPLRGAGDGWLLPTLVVLFFFSGLSGLIYQVLWMRLLALVFGVTVWAASTVLASFMAGLALGSFAAGRLVDRVQRPLVWYGLAEVLIGFSALATPLALDGVGRLYAALYPLLPPTLELLTVVRFALSFAILVVPTTLMGATLPIVVKSSPLRLAGLGERVGLLYATNTAGAIAGTLLAGFYLVGGVGMSASFQLAAALNVAVGVLAIVAAAYHARSARPDAAGAQKDAGGDKPRPYAARRSPTLAGGGAEELPTPPAHAASPPAERGPGGEVPAADGAVWPDGLRLLVLGIFAVSGFASLALEVVWFRMLLLFLPATTYAFTVMLATVLAGIAAGSYLVTPLMRRRLDWLATLALVELGVGLAALFSLTALASSYDVTARVEALLDRPPNEVVLAAIASFLAIFPAALLLGVAFPIGLRLWAAGPAESALRVGERVGVFYSLNVVGAILGAIVAGFLLLPAFGSQASLAMLSSLALISGLLLLVAWGRARRALALGAGLLGTLLFVAAALATPSPFAAALSQRYPGEQLLWREEGVQTTATVNQRASGHRVLYLDGLPQANDEPGQIVTHRLIGHLPMALHPNPRDVLVVGLGGGSTAGAVSQHRGAAVDVVELAESVARASDWLRHVNDDVLRQPNVRLRVDDGRNYMLLTPKRYDVVTADVIQPFHAGAGSVYSAEYFRLARSVLREDGLMLQWIGPLPETQYKLIMRTFLSVFPDTTLWFAGHLMVGATRPLLIDPAVFERKLEDRATREALGLVGLSSFGALLDLYWAGPEELRAYVGPGPLLTDDRPLVEYFLSLPRHEPPRDIARVPGGASRHLRR